MIRRRRSPAPAAGGLAAVLVASVAIGCGGSGGQSVECGQAGASASPSRLTPTGATLNIGQPGILEYKSLTPEAKSTIALTPKTIEKGSIGDLDGVDLEPSLEDSTPYYLEVCVTNIGSGDLSKTDPIGGNTIGEDERGESQTDVSFINGDFDRCNPVDAAGSLKKGESYGTCLVFLIPKGGGSLAKFEWLGPSDVSWKP